MTWSVPVGVQPVLVHMSKNAQGTFSFNPLSINLLVELAKTAFALSVLMIMVRAEPLPSSAVQPWMPSALLMTCLPSLTAHAA